MAVFLVGLTINRQLEETSTTGDQVTRFERVSENALSAHLVLTPDQNEDLHPLGFVHLRIEARPQSLPSMTPEQTVDWLRAALKRLL